MDFTYSETDVVKDKFIFVSYQHNDMVLVEEAVSWLMNKGVRIWFDVDLDFGDNWKNRVEKIIRHENCCGTLFFCSETAFRSEPIFYERNLVKEEIKKRGADRFFYIPINIGKPSTLQIVRDVFLHSPPRSADLEKHISCAQLEQILEMFHSQILSCYADPEDPDTYLTKIYNDIEKKHPEVISSQEIKFKKLKSIQSKNSYIKHGSVVSVTLGKWLGEKASVPGAYAQNQRLSHNGREYFRYQGSTYTAVPLQWLVLSVNEDNVVLLSDSLVDIRKADAALNAWLSTDFPSLAFSEKEAHLAQDIRLLKDQDIHFNTLSAILSNPASCPLGETLYWWIDSKAFGNNQKVVKVKDGSVYVGGLTKNKAVGIRPAIIMKYESLIKYLEETANGKL